MSLRSPFGITQQTLVMLNIDLRHRLDNPIHKFDYPIHKLMIYFSKAVVLLWFSVACFWCQSFGNVSSYRCSYYFSSVLVAEWSPFGK